MKTLIINGKETNHEDLEAKDFETFLSKLSHRISSEKHVICTIKVDGNNLSEEDENELKAMPLQAIQSVEITTADPIELSFETVDSIEEYIGRILPSVNVCAVLYEQGANHMAEKKLQEITKALETVIDVIQNVIINLKLSTDSYINLLEQDLLSTLKAMLMLKRSNDTKNLGELIKNDLTENLLEWKTKGLKHIKNKKSC